MSGVGALASLAAVFAQLSLLAFGGTNSVLPEMQRQVVEVHPWISAQEFASLFALAQAAPGPNMLVVTLIGWRVAALPGALVTTLGVAGPSSVLTFVSFKLWHRSRDAAWRKLVQRLRWRSGQISRSGNKANRTLICCCSKASIGC